MDVRISNIMQILGAKHGYVSEEQEHNRYEIVKGIVSPHKAFVNFEVSDDVIRVEMKYLFGVINQEIDIGFKDIVRMLIENTGSFQKTSAYLSVVINDDTPYLFLNSYHHFLTKWEDAIHCFMPEK